jgi:hypothetical protein
MAFDQHKNLAIATVTTATGAAGTTLGVGVGEGARFPATPFNATVWPFDMAPDPTTAEVVRVTARTGDSLTITRAQEGTTARAIIVGDFVAATITAKSLTDIESGTNFPLITTGAVSGTTGTFSGTVTAPTHASAAATPLVLAPAGTERGRLHVSGGFSWGGTTDPGAGSLSVASDLLFTGPGVCNVRAATPDGADDRIVQLVGGGAATPSRGGYIGACGNESVAPGAVSLVAGDASAGAINFYTGPTLLRGKIHPSGGFSWGGTVDHGAGAFSVGPGPNTAGGQNIVFTSSGIIYSQVLGTAPIAHMAIGNANGQVGSITSSGTTTTYNTTSDARLKTPLSRHTDTEVLRNTVIHNFVWKSDGTPGRGVFAQEAQSVAPFAVSVGSDEVDDQGRLMKPWGVDYSKYVPDLITGWQGHEHVLDKIHIELRELRTRCTAVEAATIGTSTPSWRRRLYHRIRTALNAWVPSWI